MDSEIAIRCIPIAKKWGPIRMKEAVDFWCCVVQDPSQFAKLADAATESGPRPELTWPGQDNCHDTSASFAPRQRWKTRTAIQLLLFGAQVMCSVYFHPLKMISETGMKSEPSPSLGGGESLMWKYAKIAARWREQRFERIIETTRSPRFP